MAFSYRLSTCALLLGTLATTTSASAEEAFRQHGAHVHGIVELNIAQDGQDLLMEITAPGADIVGFEHAPASTEQQQALEAAISQLKQADALFTFTPSAKCRLTEALVTETLTTHGGHDHDAHDHDSHAGHDHDAHDHDSHAGHDHDAHDHDSHAGHDHDAHDHDSHAGHDHDDHNHDSHDHVHGEFSAQYTFRCDNIQQLTSLQVSWFKHFPSTEKISIQAITETSQQAAQLTPSSILFEF